MLLIDQCIKENIKDKGKKYLEINEKNTTYKVYMDSMEAVLRGKFNTLSFFIKKVESH